MKEDVLFKLHTSSFKLHLPSPAATASDPPAVRERKDVTNAATQSRTLAGAGIPPDG